MNATLGPKLKSCWPGFWAGIGGAALTALFAMLLAPGFTMGDLERKLQAHAQAALRADPALASWARVEMDGQRATVSGAAPSEALRLRAAQTVLSSSGAGGDYVGGVTRVQNDSLVGDAVKPYTWGARRTAAGIALSGHAPSQAVKDALLAQARQIFHGAAEDGMRVAPGAPAGDWRRVASVGLEMLASLKTGEVRLVDNRLVIIGEGAETNVAALRSRAGMSPASGYDVRVDVTVEGQGFTSPGLQGINLSNPTPAVCTEAFKEVMKNNTINFAVDRADIEPRSEPLLDSLVSVALRCDAARIAVAGHTDATGKNEDNLRLSQWRANEVRNYLIARGVRADRIIADGYGSSRPIDPRATPEAFAANRRIEFSVAAEGAP
jgi:outer membrane protein OmpA-like peptidoglycan-associated protein